MSDTTIKSSVHLKWVLPLLTLAIGGYLAVQFVTSKPKPPSKPVKEKVWSVNTLAVIPGKHQPHITLYGQVEAPRMTRVTAAVTAFVAAVNTDAGKSMSPDELLVKLDDRDIKLVLQQRKAELENMESQLETEKVKHKSDLKAYKIQKKLVQLSLNTLERYDNLIQRKVASQEQLDAARINYQQQHLSLVERERSIADHPNRMQQIQSKLLSARSLVDMAKLDLSRTQIRAPFMGKVAKLSVSPGDRVRAGDAILEYYSMEQLEVRAQIPSRILAHIRSTSENTNIQAQAEIDQQRLPLELDRIAAEINPGRAGIDAFFTIKTQGYFPEPGRALAIKVKLPAQEHIIPLPPSALYGLNRIYTVTEGRLQAIEVNRIGDSLDAQGQPVVLIKSSQLQAGDRVITTQLPNAISGLRVKEVGSDA